MGKTVPSYRVAVEEEIGRWKRFRDGLAGDGGSNFSKAGHLLNVIGKMS